MSPRRAAVVIAGRDGLLFLERANDAVHLGPAYDLPDAVVEDADAEAPVVGPADAARVAALRGLFEQTGLLLAMPARLDDGARRALEQAFRESAPAGHAALAALGLRWRTEDLAEVGVLPSRGDVRPAEEVVFRLDVVARPDAGGVFLSHDAARRAWASLERPFGPAAAFALRAIVGGPRARDASGAWEVTPTLAMLPLRTPTLPPAQHTNVFLVGDEDGVVLVEPASPYAEEIDAVERWVEARLGDPSRLRAILLTHHHPDHAGGAAALAERLGAPLWAHAETASRLPDTLPIARQLDDGARVELGGGASLRAIHTPGHAPGHLCFLEESSRAMIAGDMVAGVGTILVEPSEGDMTLYLASLERMAGEGPSALLPAHGGVIADPLQCLGQYTAHRRMREDRVLDALARAGGTVSASDLVSDAYGDAPRAVWPLATLSLEAHLVKLEKDGRAVRAGAGWRVV